MQKSNFLLFFLARMPPPVWKEQWMEQQNSCQDDSVQFHILNEFKIVINSFIIMVITGVYIETSVAFYIRHSFAALAKKLCT